MNTQEELSWAEIKARFAETETLMKENYKQIKETNKQMKETNKQIKETNKGFKETKTLMKENDRAFHARCDRLEKMIEENGKHIGGMSRSNGEFCEEYFINSFKESPTFLGEKFDRVIDYLKPDPAIINDEYDLVLRNGSTIVLIEMKYKADFNDVGKMFSKLHSYRANYPMFKDYKIYLCMASFRFRADVRARAAKDGIVLIQQRGDKIEVISENVRAF
jgi:hypothetical protein